MLLWSSTCTASTMITCSTGYLPQMRKPDTASVGCTLRTVHLSVAEPGLHSCSTCPRLCEHTAAAALPLLVGVSSWQNCSWIVTVYKMKLLDAELRDKSASIRCSIMTQGTTEQGIDADIDSSASPLWNMPMKATEYIQCLV